MAYGAFKDLPKITATDKVFRDKAFTIAKNPKYDGYQSRPASMVYKFLAFLWCCYTCLVRDLSYAR